MTDAPTDMAALTDQLNQLIKAITTAYLDDIKETRDAKLYDTLMAKVERPLLETIMAHVRHNQSSAAILLGLSRGTCRKKLKQHGILAKNDDDNVG